MYIYPDLYARHAQTYPHYIKKSNAEFWQRFVENFFLNLDPLGNFLSFIEFK